MSSMSGQPVLQAMKAAGPTMATTIGGTVGNSVSGGLNATMGASNPTLSALGSTPPAGNSLASGLTNNMANAMGAGMNTGMMRAMSPLYRMRAEAFNESLPATVDACLKTYFKDLNGMSPVSGMYDKVIAQVEKPLIEHVLRYVRGNQVRAASILGINRNTLRKKIQTLSIDLNRLVGEHPHH